MQHTAHELVLENGMKGLLLDVPHASAVGFLFNFRAGDRYTVSREKTEAAHIMEHMVLGANQKIRTARAFNAELQKNGAYANATTGRVHMTYDALCPVFEWERVFGLLEDAITEPLFKEEEFASEWGNVQEEFRSYLNNHASALWQRLDQACGGTIPNDRERLGLMKNVHLRDVRYHYDKTHTSDNMRFMIAGPLKGQKDLIVKRLENWKLPRGSTLEWREDTPQPAAPLYVNRKGVGNVFYNMQWVMPKRLSMHETDVLECANHILAGTLFSRILGEARERGLAYHMWADQYAQAAFSVSEIGGEVSPSNAVALMEVAASQIKKIAKGGLTNKEVAEAHDYNLGKVQMGYQTVSSMMHYYSDSYFFDDTVESFSKLNERIKSVTKKEIVEIIRYMLECGDYGFAALSDQQSELTHRMAAPFQKL